jgi:hypothetical protein
LESVSGPVGWGCSGFGQPLDFLRKPKATVRGQLFSSVANPSGRFEEARGVSCRVDGLDGKIACIFWDAETADIIYESAMDAFVVENGKISAHIFSSNITPKAG